MGKFKYTLIFAFSITAIAGLSYLAYSSITSLSETINAEVGNSIGSIADYKVEQMEVLEKERLKKLHLIAKNKKIIEAQRFFNSNPKLSQDNEKFKQIESGVKSVVADFSELGAYYDVFLISPNGDVVYTEKRESDYRSNLRSGRYSNTGLGQVFRKTIRTKSDNWVGFSQYEPSNNEHALFVATPIFDGDEVVGVLAEQMSNQYLFDIASDYTGLGQTGEVVFAIAEMDYALVVTPLRHDRDAGLQKKIIFNNDLGKPIQQALQERNGLGRGLDYRAKEVIAAWRYIPTTNWGLVVKIDVDEAFSGEAEKEMNIILALVFSIVMVAIMAFIISYFISKPINYLVEKANLIAEGQFNQDIELSSWDEFNSLSKAFNRMVEKLRESMVSTNKELWFKAGSAKLSEVMSADQNSMTLSKNVVAVLCRYLEAQVGVVYLVKSDVLQLSGSYGLEGESLIHDMMPCNEGVIGQVINDQQPLKLEGKGKVLMNIKSALLNTPANTEIIIPICYHHQVVAVIELAWLEAMPVKAEEFLSMSMENIALAFITSEQRTQVQRMLEDSQAQTEELQVQQEELRVANDELSHKSDELEEKSETLKAANVEAERQAEELANASRYKSEFLANMSHELRTPLNSLLILARSLADNDDNNLSEEEIESAAVIHDSGKHLLGLINDILDISKVESGKMQVSREPVAIDELTRSLDARFGHMALKNESKFSVNLALNLPRSFVCDGAKVNQILTNLIGNAIKFTHQGEVSLNINRDAEEICLAVADTGIGIPEDKQATVFEAFQQADGSTSRSYGGTGLGLSIAKNFAKVLGGRIELSSVLGEGSVFSLYLPLDAETGLEVLNNNPTPMMANTRVEVKPIAQEHHFSDDRDCLDASKPALLIVEDDPNFAKVLYKACHQQGCQAIVAAEGNDGLALAKHYPIDGVVLDYMLPGLDGGEVLAALKADHATRDLPVHIVTALDELTDIQVKGSIGRTVKPTSAREIKTVIEQLLQQAGSRLCLLVVEDDDATFLALTKLLKSEGVDLEHAKSGKQAITLLHEDAKRPESDRKYQGMIMDLGLPDTNGFDLLEVIEGDSESVLPPVIIYTGKDLNEQEQQQLERFTHQVVIKSADSSERMLEEVHVFASAVAEKTKQAASNNVVSLKIEAGAVGLDDRSVLLVDDDMRNTFALAKVLRKKGMTVHLAPGGKEALESLQQHSDIEVVLMDIMMPEMDGYEATQRIREIPEFDTLPIIAVTANAMVGDREKCIESGANDYLSKPVDIDKLLPMMQLWLQ